MKGDVVVVPFPFSDHTTSKKRPALVLIDLGRDDIVCAPISTTKGDRDSVDLDDSDFITPKSLNHPSVVRASVLFTFHKNLVRYIVGQISEKKRTEIVNKIHSLMK